MGTFHPAALLRNESQKADALSDFQKLREKIKELEIEL
jgi:uracil-DNA glycosylase